MPERIKKIINLLSKEGKIFYYGSTAVFSYLKNSIKIYRILTDINIAKIGQLISELKFSKDLNFDCYIEIEEGIIVTFLINEFEEEDELQYLREISNQEKSNPLFFLFYSPHKNKYYSLNDGFINDIRKRNLNFNSINNMSIEDLLDISLIAGEKEVNITINNQINYRYNKINYKWFNQGFEINSFLIILEISLTCKNPYNALIFLDKIGILDIYFPFLNDLKGIQQDRFFHPEGDVFDHTINCFKYITRPSLRLVYGLLLHDYGKSKTVYRNGFKDHSILGSKKVKNILGPLGYNEYFIRDIEFLVEYHMINSFFYRISDDQKDQFFNNELGLDLLRLFKADTMGSIGKLDVYHDIVSNLKRKNKSHSSKYTYRK